MIVSSRTIGGKYSLSKSMSSNFISSLP